MPCSAASSRPKPTALSPPRTPRRGVLDEDAPRSDHERWLGERIVCSFCGEDYKPTGPLWRRVALPGAHTGKVMSRGLVRLYQPSPVSRAALSCSATATS